VIFLFGFFVFLSAVLPGFSLVLDPRDRPGKMVACDEFDDNEGGTLS